MDNNASAQVSLRLLNTLTVSGVSYAVIYRRDAKREEAEAYAYANTLVFEAFPGYGVYVLVMTKGTYVTHQLERYISGSWAVQDLSERYADDEMDMHELVSDMHEYVTDFAQEWIGRES